MSTHCKVLEIKLIFSHFHYRSLAAEICLLLKESTKNWVCGKSGMGGTAISRIALDYLHLFFMLELHECASLRAHTQLPYCQFKLLISACSSCSSHSNIWGFQKKLYLENYMLKPELYVKVQQFCTESEHFTAISCA